MSDTTQSRTAQLDKADREHLEDVVTDMRERIEANVRYQLEDHGLDTEPTDANADDHTELVEAIERERAAGDAWSEAYEQYITGVGYTVVNRLAALRCLEVRGFVEDEVTVFRDDGLTPAADYWVNQEFLMEDEAILRAYEEECSNLQDEIELLFDTESAYSQLDPDVETFKALCEQLDRVPDAAWRADDVLGWVYEYYNVKLLDDLRRKGDREGLEPEDVPPANQFYTPHWVVRMLTDNSLGKLYLEDTDRLEATVEAQSELSPEERKHRPLSPEETPTIEDFCTYLVPSEESGEAPDFDGPADLRVIDPACGSGHFLLYAFDVLERIWRAETDVDRAEIPRKILEHNLYGVDLDMRACQLAAFNLYLKSRTRAAAEGDDDFSMPDVGIVCADATVADVEGVEEVFDEVADGDDDIETALETILDAFEEVEGLGSLLDVRGTLGGVFEDDEDEEDGVQITLGDDPREDHTLQETLHSLREAVEERRNGDSFLAQDLRSFVRLLDILAQDYDVALMNPPYGSQNRMPNSVEAYVDNHYGYPSEFYINFFEVCDRLTKQHGAIGMLIPRSFMFKQAYEKFRLDFLGERGRFDYLAEFGLGILDNATVRTVGTVVRSEAAMSGETGTFFRLNDLDSGLKERAFVGALDQEIVDGTQRRFSVQLSELAAVPGTPICYSTPSQVRKLHQSELKLDVSRRDGDGESVARAVQGLATGNNNRFVRKHWESEHSEEFTPIAKGGSEAWTLPKVMETVDWSNGGNVLKRAEGSVIRNEGFYRREGLTWTYIKSTGRRFGYYPEGGVFSHTGFMLFPEPERSPWNMMAVLNSDLYLSLFLSITTERHWNVGEVGRIPWQEQLDNDSKLADLSRQQYTKMLENRRHDPTSPYYVSPRLLVTERKGVFYYDHQHLKNMKEITISKSQDQTDRSFSITKLARMAKKHELEINSELEFLASKIDEVIYNKLNINERTKEGIQDEIYLRTSTDPEDRQIPDPDSVPEVPDNLSEQVKDLVHHFAMEAVREESDGIIPIHDIEDHPDMLDRIVERFQAAYGEYATDRLAEVDEILGDRPADQQAYPNLRAFVEDDLFEYHTTTMENTPILWRLTSERLVADADGEGFGCFLDYHSLDDGLLDRLITQYLEPRMAALRERREAADRRRNDDSLSATAQSEAAEAYTTAESGLRQCEAFTDVLQELGQTTPRTEPDLEDGSLQELADAVAVFRAETSERIETLATLREEEGVEWFQERFSDGFWDKVDEWRDEWLDALSELETACAAYDGPTEEPVEAHLYDLFEYFNWRLKGSDHYSSSGILFMTYYFEREGDHLLNDAGKPHDGASPTDERLARLAAGIDADEYIDDEHLETMVAEADDDVETIDDLPPIAEFKALAETIDEQCQAVAAKLPSEWSERAISEVTTAGYSPVSKHGVAINVTPLAEVQIVPEIVDEKVID